MTKPTRGSAGGNELGNRRYKRYCDAFDWIMKCVDGGYHLEAIAILDSLLWDRLSSRLGHVTGKPVDSSLASGRVCRDLVGSDRKGTGCEQDPKFRQAIRRIQKWVRRRNEAMHATAKILHSESSPKDFKSVLNAHYQDAVYGIKCLQAFDELDTASRATVGKRPASFPNAFFPERRQQIPHYPASRSASQSLI
jgi:hypothetical protein